MRTSATAKQKDRAGLQHLGATEMQIHLWKRERIWLLQIKVQRRKRSQHPENLRWISAPQTHKLQPNDRHSRIILAALNTWIFRLEYWWNCTRRNSSVLVTRMTTWWKNSHDFDTQPTTDDQNSLCIVHSLSLRTNTCYNLERSALDNFKQFDFFETKLTRCLHVCWSASSNTSKCPSVLSSAPLVPPPTSLER